MSSMKFVLLLILLGYLAVRMFLIARKKGTKTMLTGLAVVIVGGYLGIGVLLYLLQPRMVYWPIAEIRTEPNEIGLSFENIYFKNADGIKLNAWYVPCSGAKLTILFCHGNGGNIGYYLNMAVMYHSMGVNCLLFDYSGYGKSEGRPTEQGTYNDAAAAYKWLVDTKRIEPNSIVAHGWSLGGAVAAKLASTEPVRGLILESTLTSASDMAGKLYPIFPAKLFCRYKYDTAKYLANVKCPVLIIHSPQDDIIPYSMGLKLFEIAKEPKRFIEISGSHNEGTSESNVCEQEILNWFKSL